MMIDKERHELVLQEGEEIRRGSVLFRTAKDKTILLLYCG